MSTVSNVVAKPVTAVVAEQHDFPVINFGNFARDPQGTAAEIFEAACRWGFLVLTNHGIPEGDVQQMFATVGSLQLQIGHVASCLTN